MGNRKYITVDGRTYKLNEYVDIGKITMVKNAVRNLLAEIKNGESIIIDEGGIFPNRVMVKNISYKLQRALGHSGYAQMFTITEMDGDRMRLTHTWTKEIEKKAVADRNKLVTETKLCSHPEFPKMINGKLVGMVDWLKKLKLFESFTTINDKKIKTSIHALSTFLSKSKGFENFLVSSDFTQNQDNLTYWARVDDKYLQYLKKNPTKIPRQLKIKLGDNIPLNQKNKKCQIFN